MSLVLKLVFNLTDAVQWAESYNGFSFVEFYNFIVDYFEAPSDNASKARVLDLVSWWNR